MSIDIKVRMRADKGHESTLELLLGDSICCPGTFRDEFAKKLDIIATSTGFIAIASRTNLPGRWRD